MLIDIEVPFDAEQTFTYEIFGEPEIEHHKDDHELIENKTVEKRGEHSSKEEDHEHQTLEGAV